MVPLLVIETLVPSGSVFLKHYFGLPIDTESRYSINIYFPVVKHIMNQHEKTPCSLCGEMVSKAAMSRHIEFKHTEQQNRKYKCSFCGKGFAQSQALKDHINTHTGEKPYMCKFCGAAFANMGSHRMHERTVHLGHKRDEKSKNNQNNSHNTPADLSKHMPLPMGFSLKK